MNREEVFEAINNERIAQDSVWRRGDDMKTQYRFAAPHIILLEEQVSKLRSKWYGERDESSLRERIIKVAAIAIRALEEIGST